MYYQKHHSIWEAPVHPMDSFTCKHLCHIRQFMLVHMYQTPNDTWIQSSAGKFSFASAWNLVGDYSPPFELAPVVWFPPLSPKMSPCLLRALHNKLLTSARLKHFGSTEHNTCVLCESSPESIQYLFFSYSCSSLIWSLCKQKLKLPSHHDILQQEATTIKDNFSKKTRTYVLSRLVLAAAVQHLWQQRNRCCPEDFQTI